MVNGIERAYWVISNGYADFLAIGFRIMTAEIEIIFIRITFFALYYGRSPCVSGGPWDLIPFQVKHYSFICPIGEVW